jgi:ankyrin repeat protein
MHWICLLFFFFFFFLLAFCRAALRRRRQLSPAERRRLDAVEKRRIEEADRRARLRWTRFQTLVEVCAAGDAAQVDSAFLRVGRKGATAGHGAHPETAIASMPLPAWRKLVRAGREPTAATAATATTTTSDGEADADTQADPSENEIQNAKDGDDDLRRGHAALPGAGPSTGDPALVTLLPLHVAALAGNVNAVRVLAVHGVRVNAPEPRTGTTALHMACAMGHAGIVDALLAAGADPARHTLERPRVVYDTGGAGPIPTSANAAATAEAAAYASDAGARPGARTYGPTGRNGARNGGAADAAHNDPGSRGGSRATTQAGLDEAVDPRIAADIYVEGPGQAGENASGGGGGNGNGGGGAGDADAETGAHHDDDCLSDSDIDGGLTALHFAAAGAHIDCVLKVLATERAPKGGSSSGAENPEPSVNAHPRSGSRSRSRSGSPRRYGG